MGLTDALLLDPYPFEIWIAQRGDGQKGSGTLNDPYDGTTAAKFDGIMTSFSWSFVSSVLGALDIGLPSLLSVPSRDSVVKPPHKLGTVITVPRYS